ncbi:hypothetical protein GPEL0_01f4089 [Geoanaerobacter pelophilus]|uniref:DUF4384 domain-containing protein n=1 Tax=Geoanaerobacter pelophilus TaxID=60036 RepID=A0ABQ0MLK4_9BACT|nr:DUF4384 domain-containing protein [Geoanaerobacter pelophilus]GAW67975.1 hypothetical protein GPEL0_01f4089 [Geoanaerobacter pelophilus]
MLRIFLFFTFILSIAFTDRYAFCSTAAPIEVVVEGEAVGSDLESPREVLERAKADAQRKAIEQAVGSFIRSHTVVSNSQLAEDLIYARVRGRIDKLELLSQWRDKEDPNRFFVKVKATVAPQMPSADEGLQLKAGLSRSELVEGDELSLQYQASADCFVYIFVIGADNSVTQLLPNSVIRNNLIKAGQSQTFPPEGSGIRLAALLQPGQPKAKTTEKIKLIATKKEEPLLQLGFQEGFKVYDARSTGLASDLLRRLAQLDPGDWGEATVAYTIAPRKQ